MKAVAGVELKSSRELPHEEDHAAVVTEEQYAAAIDQAARRHPGLIVQIKQSECFASMWQDESGVCPEVQCNLRAACQEAYNAVHDPAVAVAAQPAKPVVAPKATKKLFGGDKVKRRGLGNITDKKRNKWQGTGKYQRQGYVSMGRPVDQALGHLIEGLGNPTILPKGWHHTQFDEHYKKLGRLLLSQTSSYTSVMVDGRVLLRFWTNAGGCAIVDFAPDIHAIVTAFKPLGRAVPVPDGSRKKLAPCEYRSQLNLGATTHKEMLTLLGAQIRMAYKL
jgi:hypothetical protein